MSSTPIQLIVGLANPGKQYESTRHNAGAWFVENIADHASVQLRQEMKFHGMYGQTTIDGHSCHLLIPTTFMNLSGQSVRAVMNFYKIAPASVLVAHDEIDLPAGVTRLKFDGGDGGHNGLKDIIRHLSSKQFYRLRIGVGRPEHGDVADYVLDAPSKADRKKIDASLEKTDSVLPLLLQGEIQKAMHALHTQLEE